MRSETLKGDFGGAFFDQVELVRIEIAKQLFLSAGPAYFDGVNVGRFAEAKICAEIALRKIAAATGDFTDLRDATGKNADTRAHGVAVAFAANEFQVQEMIAVAAHVAQQKRGVSVVPDNQFHKAVVVEIGEGDTASDVRGLKSWAGNLSSLYKPAFAFIVK